MLVFFQCVLLFNSSLLNIYTMNSKTMKIYEIYEMKYMKYMNIWNYEKYMKIYEDVALSSALFLNF